MADNTLSDPDNTLSVTENTLSKPDNTLSVTDHTVSEADKVTSAVQEVEVSAENCAFAPKTTVSHAEATHFQTEAIPSHPAGNPVNPENPANPVPKIPGTWCQGATLPPGGGACFWKGLSNLAGFTGFRQPGKARAPSGAHGRGGRIRWFPVRLRRTPPPANFRQFSGLKPPSPKFLDPSAVSRYLIAHDSAIPHGFSHT